MKRKLEINEYIFTYKKEDIKNVILEYNFDTITLVSYKTGIKIKTDKPLINFNISGDENMKNYVFSFSLLLDLSTLNKFSNIQTNINEYVVSGETIFFNGDNFEILDEDFKDIYKYTPVFFVSKIDNDKFIFKIQYEDIFIWFLSDFT